MTLPEQVAGFLNRKNNTNPREKFVDELKLAINTKKTQHIGVEQVLHKSHTDFSGSLSISESAASFKTAQPAKPKKKAKQRRVKPRNKFLDDMAEVSSESCSSDESDGSEVKDLIDDSEVESDRNALASKFLMDFISRDRRDFSKESLFKSEKLKRQRNSSNKRPNKSAKIGKPENLKKTPAASSESKA